MTDLKEKILMRVQPDLVGIEAALEENLNPLLGLVSRVARHILFSGGKRLRPLLTVLSARVCGYQGAEAKTTGVVFEYLHAATLLHDDIVDGGTLRRGKAAAHSIWGSPVAVLVGDFLLARCISLATETNNLEIVKIVAAITETMSQGELDQLDKIGKLDITESEYFDIIRSKTAVLFKGACRTGALVAGARKAYQTALAEYGLNMGIAFQMTDDLIDYTSDTATLGKGSGADLREGKLTLPVIYSLGSAAGEERAHIVAIIERAEIGRNGFSQLVRLLEHSGGFDYTRNKAERYVGRAKTALSIFQPSEALETLKDIADYALVRKA